MDILIPDSEQKKILHKNIQANQINNVNIDRAINKVNNQYDLILIEHKWNENPTSLYNKISNVWDMVGINGKVLIISHKKQGANTLLSFLIEKGLISRIAGKGRGGVRLLEVFKENVDKIESIETLKSIQFSFDDKIYSVFVDNTVFSKEKLDSGTEFLLNVFFKTKIDLNGKKIGDFGSGWGAISLILINAFPKAEILAIEKDAVSFLLSEKNLSSYSQIEILQADLTNKSLLTPSHIESLDYIICNPPFHITEDQVNVFILNVKKFLKSNGEIFYVVEKTFANKFRKISENLLTTINTSKNDHFFVFRYRKDFQGNCKSFK